MVLAAGAKAFLCGIGVLGLRRGRWSELWLAIRQKGQLGGDSWLGYHAEVAMKGSLGGAGTGRGVAHCAVGRAEGGVEATRLSLIRSKKENAC